MRTHYVKRNSLLLQRDLSRKRGAAEGRVDQNYRKELA